MNKKEMEEQIEKLSSMASDLYRRVMHLETDHNVDRRKGSPTEGRYIPTMDGAWSSGKPGPYPPTRYCPVCRKAVIVKAVVQLGMIECADRLPVVVTMECSNCKHGLQTVTQHIDL